MAYITKEDFATMKNKFGKVAIISLLGLLGLSACSSSDIVAKPTDYDDELVTIDGEKDIFNNIMSVVYDAQRSGSVASDVLDEVLYQYAMSVFGSYNKVTSKGKEGTTLKEAFKAITKESDDTYTGTEVADEFIKSHKAYWTVDSEGNRVNDENVAVADDASPCNSEYARVVEKWNTIEKRIAQAMYAEISSGTYSDRNIFSEKSYLKTLYNGMKHVANPYDSTLAFTESMLTPDVEDYEVFTKGLLHREHYQSNYDGEESKDEANHYIEDVHIPDIYNELLVEQYLLNETYNTLGRSSARKVNIIAITKNTNYDKAADYLINDLIDQISTGKVDSDKILDTFKSYSKVWNGTPSDIGSAETEILNRLTSAGVFKESTVSFAGVDYTYNEGTAYGDLIEKLDDIKANPDTTKEDVENEFTNSGAYPYSVGIEIKTNEIKLKDYTTTGWYIKNGGLSDLPEAIRNRLFNIGVANGKKETEEQMEGLDRWNGTEYSVPENESSYLALINGRYYLKQESTLSGEDKKNDIKFYDSSSSTYYIVEVEEAVISSKLSKTSTNSYNETRESGFMESVVNEVAKQIGSGDTYKKLAKEYWLKEMSIKYHDTTVYDYFKSNYPDLFED